MTVTLTQAQVEDLAKAFWKLDKVIKEDKTNGSDLKDAHTALKDVLRSHNIVDDWGNIWEDHK